MKERIRTCDSCGGEANGTSAFCPSCCTEPSHRPAPPPTPPPEFAVARRGERALRPEANTPLVIKILGRILLLVVACGILVVLLQPNVGFQSGQSNEWAARTQMSNFGQAVSNYRSIYKKLPGTLEELTQTSGDNPYPFIQSIPNDPWGEPYRYRVVDSKHFQILSTGEDGVADTDDDLKFPDEDD